MKPLKQEKPREMPKLLTDITVDERDAAWLAEATEFSATMRLQGRAINDTYPNIVQAAARASQLEELAGSGKQAMVYAITPAGHATLVQRAAWTELTTRACELVAKGEVEAALDLRLDPELCISDAARKAANKRAGRT